MNLFTRYALPAALGATILAAPVYAAPADKGLTDAGSPWTSGVIGNVKSFEKATGERVSANSQFMPRPSWRAMRGLARAKPDKVNIIGIPMLPTSHRGQLAQCATGAFDNEIREIARSLASNGWGDAWGRLGWEMNALEHNPFAWAATTGPAHWVGCYRRWVDVLRANGVAGMKFHFNPANKTTRGKIDDLYPGSEYVDAIGANFYDRCPVTLTEADWNKNADGEDERGNPLGPQAWMRYAFSKGKPYALGEWGIGRGVKGNCRKPGRDNPFFVKKMHELFDANASRIAYEVYFNKQRFQLPKHRRAAAVYRRLW